MDTQIPKFDGGALSSKALEHDAEEAGVDADEATHRERDTALPASEGGHVDESRAKAERGLSNVPPG